MRRGSLLTQVIAANLLLILAAVLAASLATSPEALLDQSETAGLVLGLALAATVAVNVYLLSHRFRPLERLVEAMEGATIGSSDPTPEISGLGGSDEVRTLTRAFREMLDRLESQRREAASAALAAQERERARLALDLHDEVNQALTGLLLRIEAVRRTAPEEMSAELTEIAGVAANAMKELIALARQLRPTALDDLGLEAALEGLVDEVGKGGRIATRFESEGVPADLSGDLALVSYRIAQEAISNAVQHGEPERIVVKLRECEGMIDLEIADDGHGFDDPEAAGLGIAGMRERALLVGADLEIDSQPGTGTDVRLRA